MFFHLGLIFSFFTNRNDLTIFVYYELAHIKPFSTIYDSPPLSSSSESCVKQLTNTIHESRKPVSQSKVPAYLETTTTHGKRELTTSHYYYITQCYEESHVNIDVLTTVEMISND